MLYLTSYSTYIEHGIATRVALEAGIPVWSFGNLVQFGKKLTLHDWVHTPDCRHYRAAFEELDDKPSRLAHAERELSTRLSGGIDAATSYMKVSAYAASSSELPDVKDAVVIFLHDFYDSPHVYHDLVFPDFWSWICFTIETLRNAGIPFFVKPHPNQISLSSVVLDELKHHYPDLPFLPVDASNARLAALGIRCGVTVYGTVAHELAYLGVPTIGCARHPHIAFDFCRTAKTVDEYRALLLKALDDVDRPSLREQALQFYYMHNLHGSEAALDVKRKWVAFWAANNGAGRNEGAIVESLQALRAAPGFKQLIDALRTEMA